LERLLDDGRLPKHYNHSEQALRREAVGRKNWSFIGNDGAGDVNAAFVSPSRDSTQFDARDATKKVDARAAVKSLQNCPPRFPVGESGGATNVLELL
jgi:transposase IS66 family protein